MVKVYKPYDAETAQKNSPETAAAGAALETQPQLGKSKEPLLLSSDYIIGVTTLEDGRVVTKVLNPGKFPKIGRFCRIRLKISIKGLNSRNYEKYAERLGKKIELFKCRASDSAGGRLIGMRVRLSSSVIEEADGVFQVKKKLSNRPKDAARYNFDDTAFKVRLFLYGSESPEGLADSIGVLAEIALREKPLRVKARAKVKRAGGTDTEDKHYPELRARL